MASVDDAAALASVVLRAAAGEPGPAVAA